MAKTQEAAARPPAPAPPQTPSNVKWIGLALAIVIGTIIMLMPTPAGLMPTGQKVLAIAAFTVVLWVFQVMNNGIASMLMMALMIGVAGIPPPQALSGFSDGAWWILLSVLFFGCAMKNTGLAQRISYYILTLFPATYTGILSAFFLVGLVLALGIPSMTVRTAIMVPIAWALVQSLGIKPQSNGSALIMLTSVEMAVVPGVGFLYSSLNGPVIESVFKAKNLPLSWTSYAAVMAVPTLVICVLLILVNQLLFKPEAPLNVGSGFARNELAALGNVKQSELITGVVVLASIALWVTGGLRLHTLPSFVIGMCALAVFGLTGVIKDSDIGTGVSWTLLLFLGGVFSMGNIIKLPNVLITDWIGGYLVPIVTQMGSSPFLFIAAMTLAVLTLRFIDPTGFLIIPVLFLPIVAVMMAAGINPLVVVAPTTVASAPFWLSYENIWVAMTEGFTGHKGFTGTQRVLCATAYAAVVLVTLVISVVFWKMTGAIQ